MLSGSLCGVADHGNTHCCVKSVEACEAGHDTIGVDLDIVALPLKAWALYGIRRRSFVRFNSGAVSTALQDVGDKHVDIPDSLVNSSTTHEAESAPAFLSRTSRH